MTTKEHTHKFDAEELRIQTIIASGTDSPERTDDDFASANPFTEAFPEMPQKMLQNIEGRPEPTVFNGDAPDLSAPDWANKFAQIKVQRGGTSSAALKR